MRVVVWNMAHRVASWQVIDELVPDIALLSEARAPKGIQVNIVGGVSTKGLDGYRRSWATAVISGKHPLREVEDAHGSRRGKPIKVPFANSRPGSWVTAATSIPGFGDITAVSLYGLMDERSDASVHRSLSELTPLFEDSRYNRLLLLGGDLNTWTGWRPGPHLERDRVVLDRIRAFGLVDCLQAKRPPGPLKGCPCTSGLRCTHTRTRLDAGKPNVPYQMDYLFASAAMVERLVTCEALPHDRLPSPSDHFPILATFN
jgi:hypothetical protein